MAVAGSGAICGLRTGGRFTSRGKISCKGDIGGTPSGSGYKEIVAGKEHFCAIDEKDFLHCWGPKCKGDEEKCWWLASGITVGIDPMHKGLLGKWMAVDGSKVKQPESRFSVGVRGFNKAIRVDAAENATCYIGYIGGDGSQDSTVPKRVNANSV